jgi:hypothetical protein
VADDRLLLGQVLLRCPSARIAGGRCVTPVGAFGRVIDCQAFRQNREPATEWAEVTSAVWTSQRRLSEDHTGNDRSEYGTDDDDTADNDTTRFVLHDSSKLDHIFDVSPEDADIFYDENGRIAQPGTSQNTIDLMVWTVDQTIVGRAEYALVKTQICNPVCLGQVLGYGYRTTLFQRLTGRPKISVVQKAMPDDGCAGRQDNNILFISMFRWEEEYRNNSYIGARGPEIFSGG